MQLGPGSGQFNPAGQQALQSNIAGQQAMSSMGRGRGQSFDPQQAEMTMALAQMEREDRRADRAADREMNMMQFAASREDANRRHQLDTMRTTSDVEMQSQQIATSKEHLAQSRRDREALENASKTYAERREAIRRQTIEAARRGAGYDADRARLSAQHEDELHQYEQNLLRVGATVGKQYRDVSEGLTSEIDRLVQLKEGRSVVDTSLASTLTPLIAQDLKASELSLPPDNETHPVADMTRRLVQSMDVFNEWNPFVGFQAEGFSPARSKWEAVRGGAPTSDAFLASEYPNVVQGQAAALVRYLETMSPNDTLPDSVPKALGAFLHTFSPITGSPTDNTDEALSALIGELQGQKIDPYVLVSALQRMSVEYEQDTFAKQQQFGGDVLVSGSPILPGEFVRDTHLADGVGGGAYSDTGGLQIALHNRSVMAANIARNAARVAVDPAFNGVMSTKRLDGMIAVLRELTETPEVSFEDVLRGNQAIASDWIPSEQRVRDLSGIHGLHGTDVETLLRHRGSVASLADLLKNERTRIADETRDIDRRQTAASLDMGRQQAEAEAAAQAADLAALEQLMANMSPSEVAALVALEAGG